MRPHRLLRVVLIGTAASCWHAAPALAHGSVQWSATLGAAPVPVYPYPTQPYRYYVPPPPAYYLPAPPPPVVVYPQQPFAYGPPPSIYSVPPGTVVPAYPVYPPGAYPLPYGYRYSHPHDRWNGRDGRR